MISPLRVRSATLLPHAARTALQRVGQRQQSLRERSPDNGLWLSGSLVGGSRMARRMALTFDPREHWAHAAYTVNIVIGLCPCCWATQSGFRPAINFQLIRLAIADREEPT